MSQAVIDQPGLRVVAVGLCFALIFGFVFRTQISPDRVEKSLQRSVQILEKDFLIDFDKADVRLTKWGLPLPHLVVSKLRLSPKKSQCQNSQIYIDELEIPLHFKNLVTSDKAIDFIRAKTMEVRLVDLDSCLAQSGQQRAVATADDDRQTQQKSEQHMVTITTASAAQQEPKPQRVQEQVIANLFSQNTSARLKEIAIDELKIISLKNYDQPVVFKQFKIFLNYEDSRLAKIDVKSRLYSIKDSRSDIYFLIADMTARFVPEPLNQMGVTLQLKGRLLDGDIQAFAQASTQNQKVAYEINTHNVSLKAYAPLINRKNKDTLFLDRWPLSASFYMVGEAQLGGNDPRAIFKFKNFNAIGENMKMVFPEANIELVSKQTFLKPFQVHLDRIPLAPLKIFFTEQFDFQSVENLGIVTGKFNFDDQRHWDFDGNIQKAELIFSNRGSREIEVIDSVGLRFDYKGKELNFSLNDIVIQQNKVNGGLDGKYMQDPSDLRLKLNLDGKILSEKIWRQLTQVAQSPSVKLSWMYRKTGEERHQIKINSPELEFPGVRLLDVQIDFLQLIAGEVRSLALSLKTNRSQIRVSELRPNVAKAFFNETTELIDENYTALKTQVGLQGTGWKNMNFDVDSHLFDAEGFKGLEQLKIKGEWKSDSRLSGFVSLQNPKRTLKYNLVKKDKGEIDFVSERKVD